MKLTFKKTLACLLALSMVFTMSFGVSAADKKNDTAHKVDNILDSILDGALGLFGRIFTQPEIPTVEEYGLESDEYFYEGTNGPVGGTADQWKLGFSSTSVIPSQWRLNADGEPDVNGWNLNDKYYFGGYFTARVDKIYDDETVNLVVMSAGSDANENGVEDIIIFAALDGIGFSSASVRDVREATEKALLAKGVAHEDIIGFEFNVTHAHSVIDPQGMGMDMFLYLIKNKITGITERSIEDELLESICENTAKAVVDAYERMENGNLYYFESKDISKLGNDTIDIISDKNERGANAQSFFACFLFEGESGEKTILANIGMHPTKVSRDSRRVSGDVPHYIGEAMNEAGYNFVYIQGAQGAVGMSLRYTEKGAEWANSKTLSYEEWAERYGEKYASKNYVNDKDDGEQGYWDIKATGYTIAHVILDAISHDTPVAPTLNVKMSEFVAPLNYGLIYLGAVTGLLGFNTVTLEGTETGYGIVAEIGYIEIGKDIAMLVLPGEISPAIVFGTDPRFEGDTLWTGETSWSGEEWGYNSLAEYVRIASGDSDKTVIAMGIANDAIGYVFPDNDVVKCFLTDSLGFAENHYEELLMSSPNTGSAMVEGFLKLLNVEK